MKQNKKLKLVSTWTIDDLHEYMNRRACDGNWSLTMAKRFTDFINEVPKNIFKRKKWFEENKGKLLNLDLDPIVNIETGEVFENLQVLD